MCFFCRGQIYVSFIEHIAYENYFVTVVHVSTIMASAMLKKSSGKNSDNESTVSMPVKIPLNDISSENVFDRIRAATTTRRLSVCETGAQSSPRATTSQSQVSDVNENTATENRNFDNLTKCLETLTNTITSGFRGLRSDIIDLVSDQSESHNNDYESEYSSDGESESQIDNIGSNSSSKTLDDLLASTKLSGSISGKASASGKTENEKGSQATFLKVAAEQITSQDVTTDPINKDLAKLVDDLMFKAKVDKKLADQVKESAEKIKRPENCESLVCTKVDELIWNRLQVATKSLDSRFQHGQLFLVKSVTILVNILEKIVSNKDLEKENLVRELIKTIEMLSFSNYEVNMRRRECLKGDIDSVNYLSLFSSGVPINQYLFGGELGKRLDEIEKTNKAVNKVMTNKSSKQRGNFQGNRGRRFQPYSRQGNNRGRNGPFLGQNPRRGDYNKKFKSRKNFKQE
uniref:Uncharacterized protein LOC111117880 isoform X1 n=1 Tax=Crassostrea virginica TaxID=6565 RepID=A0A8B8CAP0_CRAVI|nr:uncharacterized protein LOC111117880 isoform X1 [Crassostrea virginica]